MDVCTRSLSLVLAVIALTFATARTHISSHDNIFRIQLWDAEGLSREPVTTTSAPVTKRHKLEVNLDSLYNAMLEESHGGGFGRFTRHKVRHKRRRPRQSGTEAPWRFHSGSEMMNVAVYSDEVPWDVIEANNTAESVNASVSDSGSSTVNERDAGLPATLRQVADEVMSEGKQGACNSFHRYRRLEVVNSHSHN